MLIDEILAGPVTLAQPSYVQHMRCRWYSPRMADVFFQATNTLALAAWVALVLFPSQRLVSGVVCGIVIPAGLAAAYALIIGWKLAAGGPPPGDLTTIAGLQAAFADDWVFAAAWTHYLAFDMVVGAWIARDAVRLGIAWPVRTVALVLTFLMGPVGFLLHVIARRSLRIGTDSDAGPVRDAAAGASSRW